MNFEIQASNKRTKKFLEAIMPSIIEQLGLTRSKKCVLVSVSKNCDHSGLSIPLPGINGYFIGIKPSTRPGEVSRTLCHEMVHVAQMSKGILKSVKGGEIWANKFYPKNTAYLDRPWEQQAFAMQELIMRRALEE
jgi:hypothetical protein